MFHVTMLLETAMMSPRGNVRMTPAPIVAGRFRRRKKFNGTVGPVPHAKAVCKVPAGSATSSARTVIGVVGVTPIACGRPRPMTEAVAAAINHPRSLRAPRSVAAVLNSKLAFAIVMFDVLFARYLLQIGELYQNL